MSVVFGLTEGSVVGLKNECCVWPTEGSVVGLTTAERREVTERVLCEMKATGLPFHVYKLHQVILL